MNKFVYLSISVEFGLFFFFSFFHLWSKCRHCCYIKLNVIYLIAHTTLSNYIRKHSQRMVKKKQDENGQIKKKELVKYKMDTKQSTNRL